MGFLDKIFKRGSAAAAEGLHADVPVEERECPHTNLIPGWDEPDDIGHEDKATRFACSACGGAFTPDEARELRETEAERIGAAFS